MKLRTKHLADVGHFAQVRHGSMSGWKTIGKHPNGYVLYSENHLSYPLDSAMCATERCNNYKDCYNVSKGVATYKEHK